MRIAISEQLDPAPFREWSNERIRDEKSDGAGGHLLSPGELAQRLGVHTDVLRRWRRGYETLNRAELEDALRRAGYEIWDVYPDLRGEDAPHDSGFCPACAEEVGTDEYGLCLWCDTRTDRHREPRKPPGARGKFRDRHFRALHKLHTDGGLPIRELSRRTWRQAGYSSAKSAETTIRRGFERLGLPIVNRRVNPAPPPERRCQGSTPTGEQCTAWSMVGDKVCWMHHPDNHEQLSLQARVANAKRHGLPLEIAA